ncbi:L-methionine/branched-chain amino acid transporter [Zophobihabitans entericus]|uniref:L-methionine/branched-chain amino acid transporter n=1 Tax=Zophobihabitans entericus TaxID=1635327 RepID=A0A6G9IF44_9GAMM|nr:L-methionine/branched-chain amino acid transporter [Zophobihabitans entericus]QIQ22220.1 L-methionine/branched-chain amino acid transporter [Zophobihabitans entericus]
MAGSELKKELSLLQGIGLLSTSLLGTGVFAVPAIVAYGAGGDGLWAWPLLLVLVFPVAIIFAQLGKRYPSAGGVAYFIARAFSPKLGRATAWAFLSVIPFGLPAALYISSGFWISLFNLPGYMELLIQIITLLLIWSVGLFGAGASGWIQSAIAILIIGLMATICLVPSPTVLSIEWPSISSVNANNIFSAFAVMFWCFVGLEAFVHLTSEFKNAERDFPRALIIGLIIAGFVYWACTAAILYFLPIDATPTTALPKIIELLFGQAGLWVICIIGYLACFASINVYIQSFARLIWSQTSIDYPDSRFAQLSRRQTPVNALTAVILCSLIASVLIYFVHIPLDHLLEYSNGVFVLIYLLAMVAAIKLLKGQSRILAMISAVICLGLLAVIGYKSLYAIGIFVVLCIVLKNNNAIKKLNH